MTRKISRAAMLQRLGLGTKPPALALDPVPSAKRSYSTVNRPRTTTAASGARGDYDSARWKREARAFVAGKPCVEGCGRPATLVDHRVPVRPAGDPRFFDKSNWQAMCRPCHQQKTRVEQGEDGRLSRVKQLGPKIKGCDSRGLPLPGSGHPWDTGGPGK